MTTIPRRDFLKTAVTSIGVLAFLGLDAEAREIARRTDLVEGVAKPGTPAALWPADREAAALRFLIVGDWGWVGIGKHAHAAPGENEENAANGRGEQKVAAAMTALANVRHPAAVLSVGDNFYPDGVKSVDDPRWALAYEGVYSAPSLQVPWHVALGNHDYRGSVQAQIDYSKKSPRWRMPARYFSYTEKSPVGVTVEFFVLDTNPFAKGLHKGGHTDVAKQDTGVQLAWLERALTASTADWKILVGHHPLWTGGVRRDLKEQDLAAILPPIMRRHGISIYLCGHEHDAQHIERDGLHCLIVGNGGDTRPAGITPGSRFAEARLGFAYATVDATQASIHFVDTAGDLRHTATIPRPADTRAAPPTAPHCDTVAAQH